MDLAWMDDAACKDEDTGTFYRRGERRRERALMLCWTCPVQEACEQFAMENSEEYGVWGGYTPSERRARGMLPRPKERDWVLTLRGCGTVQGFEAHIEKGEEPCDACRGVTRSRDTRFGRTVVVAIRPGKEAPDAQAV